MLGLKIGIDFGSSNLTVYVDGRGTVMREPSVMICDSFSGRVIAFGQQAREMSEKLPLSMTAVYPIRNGIVSDRDRACIMLRRYLNKICFGKLLKPNVLMCVPAGVTELQKRTVFDLVTQSGAGRACFVDEALASALGAGVSLSEPSGTAVCDIGAAVTDCSVVTMGNIALSRTAEVGGDDLTNAVISYIQHKFRIKIGAETAEHIKKSAGTAILREDEVAVISAGKNIDTGLPEIFEISSSEIFKVLRPVTEKIVLCIIRVLENTPPELSGDIKKNGIILTGGTAKLFGLAALIEERTGIKTVTAQNPEECAAIGLGRLLKDMAYLSENGYIFKSGNPENKEDED